MKQRCMIIAEIFKDAKRITRFIMLWEAYMDKEKNRTTIQSVTRALDILEYIVKTGDGFPLGKIAEACHLNKTTAYHLLRTLESRGYVEQSYDSQFYKAGWMLYTIAGKTFENLTVVQAARPYVQQLFDKYNETIILCYGAQGADKKIGFCLYEMESDKPLHSSMPTGTQFPLHCTAAGKLYLASLPEAMRKEELNHTLEKYTVNTVTDKETLADQLQQVKKLGFCIEKEEYQEGVCTIAVPVYKYTGRVIFSLGISLPIQRAENDVIKEMITFMKPMANELSKIHF